MVVGPCADQSSKSLNLPYSTRRLGGITGLVSIDDCPDTTLFLLQRSTSVILVSHSLHIETALPSSVLSSSTQCSVLTVRATWPVRVVSI